MQRHLNTLIIAFLLSFCVSCKKQPATCGCDALAETGQSVQGQATMGYSTSASKWLVSVNSNAFYYNYYICNLSQDSVRQIIQSGNTNSTYNVTFTGTSRPTCDGETFGWQQANGVNHYIQIESIRRQ